MFACPVSWGLQRLAKSEESASGASDRHRIWRSLIKADHSLDLALLKHRLELSVHIGVPIARGLVPPELRDPFQAAAAVCWPRTPGIVPEAVIRANARLYSFSLPTMILFPCRETGPCRPCRRWAMQGQLYLKM